VVKLLWGCLVEIGCKFGFLSVLGYSFSFRARLGCPYDAWARFCPTFWPLIPARGWEAVARTLGRTGPRHRMDTPTWLEKKTNSPKQKENQTCNQFRLNNPTTILPQRLITKGKKTHETIWSHGSWGRWRDMETTQRTGTIYTLEM
jgi:hypothetical protein